jgi:bifunctional UDP-N-acetylglucosamine pyrophosphorylase/glucosamine-1-phosphate N-acetyltransferase
MEVSAVILAAGHGTRMKSTRPKVLHPVTGEPMIKHVVRAVSGLPPHRLVLVVGYGGEEVRQALGDEYLYVEQEEQLGTGHALLQARELLEGKGDTVLVLFGDHPLITTKTLRRILDEHEREDAAITTITFHPADPTGYGRIRRDKMGRVLGIVEEAAASEEEKRIGEVNDGVLCFREGWLWPHLEKIEPGGRGEYYLTDLLALAVEESERVLALSPEDEEEALGVNSRIDLARAEAVIRQRVRERLMLSGVTIVDPPSTFVDSTVRVGQDTVLHPHTILEGATTVGADSSIGPGSHLRDTKVGDGCTISHSLVVGTVLEEGVDVGPFSHLRPGTHLASGVHVGNFVEIKESYIGPGTRVGHFSYIGDATLGREVNVGAGTITCNYDGERKHRTIVEDHVFLGSDTMLVAPVKVGAGAKTGAGSVVTRDIPPGSLAYGAPARVRREAGSKEVWEDDS